MNLGIVMPVYREKNIFDAVLKFKKKYKKAIIIVVADDIGSAIEARRAGAIVPFHNKKLGYGKSLVEGLKLAFFTYECDVVVTVDVDYNPDEINKFIRKVEHHDVCVGIESKEGWHFSRKLSNWLVKTLLLGTVKNPTCGFVAWNGKFLEKIPWSKVKSKWDAIHIELLFWAWKKDALFTEVEFPAVEKKRKYGIRRHISWGISFLRLTRLRWLWFWRNF